MSPSTVSWEEERQLSQISSFADLFLFFTVSLILIFCSIPSFKFDGQEDDDLYAHLKALQRQEEFLDIQEEYIKDEMRNLKRELIRAREVYTFTKANYPYQEEISLKEFIFVLYLIGVETYPISPTNYRPVQRNDWH